MAISAAEDLHCAESDLIKNSLKMLGSRLLGVVAGVGAVAVFGDPVRWLQC